MAKKKQTPTRVLIVGGYGTFGRRIAAGLAGEPDLQIVVAGRSAEKAQDVATQLTAAIPADAAALDIDAGFPESLAALAPDVVVHTSGPFQEQGYGVAEACIAQGRHYIDLADGRDFVAGIGRLDAAARERGVLAVSGASSVPALTSAIVERYSGAFERLETLDIGITATQRSKPGLASTAAVLSSVGRPFETLIDGEMRRVHGWQGLQARDYPGLGRRWIGYCDVPDLTLFPEAYPDLRTVRFQAGTELSVLNFALLALSGARRAGLVSRPEDLAAPLHRASRCFDRFGTERSGFHMALSGRDDHGRPKTITFYLIARNGEGPQVPCVPAILVAKSLARCKIAARGARPCMGFVTLEDYLEALRPFAIEWQVVGGDAPV